MIADTPRAYAECEAAQKSARQRATDALQMRHASYRREKERRRVRKERR